MTDSPRQSRIIPLAPGRVNEVQRESSQASARRVASQPASFWQRTLLWTQGIYYLLTGLWPILHVQSFQAVTGRKTDHLVTGNENDHWLLMTVSGLIVAVAGGMLMGAGRSRAPGELVAVAVLAAMGLTTIDVVYVSRGVIA